MWQKFVYLGLAGAAGTITRYWLSGVVQRNVTTAFPVGTAAVNILGCLLFGLLWAFVENTFVANSNFIFILYCMMGVLTKISSLIYNYEK